MKIEELDLSVRAYNCLKRANIDTVEQLRTLSADDLLHIRNMVKKCVDEITAKLTDADIHQGNNRVKEYPIMNDPIFLTAKAFSILHPGIEYDAYWDEIEPDENGETRYGFTIFPDDGCIPQVFISAELSPAIAAEIFGHELAHIVAGPGVDHGEAWENEFEAIFQKYIEISDMLFSKEDDGNE